MTRSNEPRTYGRGRPATMNIVVCVKYVPDAQSDRTFNESDNTTDRVGVDGLLSELDEYAVEEALKLAEAGEGEVTVLTVGPDQAATSPSPASASLRASSTAYSSSSESRPST